MHGRLVRDTSPFAGRMHEPDAVFVEPHVPAEIRYLERTFGGRLRQAAFRPRRPFSSDFHTPAAHP